MGNPGRLIIICGLPGSGKTTMASDLAARTGGARFCPDDEMIEQQIDLRDASARARIEADQWERAQEVLRNGGVAIIEWGVWGVDERVALRDGARQVGARVELQYLDVPIDVLWSRIRARGQEQAAGAEPITFAELQEWTAVFQEPDAAELASYDVAVVVRESGDDVEGGHR